MKSSLFSLLVLVAGDVIALAFVTVWGFAAHNIMETAGTRLWATLVSLVVAWVLVGVTVNVFDPDRAMDARQLWRPVWAMLLAAPLAGWLRGLWTGGVVVPIFVAVIGGISALALLIWRGLYWGLHSWKKEVDG